MLPVCEANELGLVLAYFHISYVISKENHMMVK